MSSPTKSLHLSEDSKIIYLAARPRVFVKISPGRVQLEISDRFSCQLDAAVEEEALLAWLRHYAKRVPLPWTKLPNSSLFQREVYTALSQIPWGETASYGQVASSIGIPKGARAIGNACRANPFPLFIPCHRVVSGSRKLGGYTPDPRIKKELLDFEGVSI